ncbi:MAG TPA: hypothetical protein VIL16_21205, partial [Trebonia sp.]
MEPRHDRSAHRPSRRAFLGAAAAAGALAWVPVFRATPASAQATSSPPTNFPSTISVYQQAYQNWSGMIVVDDVWTCAPTSAGEVVTLANWAHANGYRLRAKGMSHGWSPLVLPEGSTSAGYVLVDTTQHLTSATISPGTPAMIAAQAGITMNKLTSTLAAAGYGLCA